ncbi:MAG: CPBP family intramembrane metalloprotease [Bacteroidetes bacterium]|nr:CPBP family intramembrane metalloprotease [Bacteroidota bacterium]MDA1120376.1 CPBP family intramembrane metalloprotease [Bacteroidota bacterium]
MKKVLKYLKQFQSEHFHFGLYATTLGFLAVCIFINYYFDIDDQYLDQFNNKPLDWPLMSLFQAFPFLAICLLFSLFSIDKRWLKNKDFWFRVLIGFTILGFSRGFYYHQYLLTELERIDRYFLTRTIRWASFLFTAVLPFIIVNLLIEKGKDRNLYGLKWQNFDWKPYAVLLLIAAGFLAIGSFLGEIQSYYPRYIRSGGTAFAILHSLSEWVSVVIYEVAYGSSFVSVEIIFRGYLVMAFSRILGGYAVIAMVGSYCFLHFGKPLGETITSIFGGYVLGIISYYTRNIWGGIWIHVGVAWLMELFAWLQR